MQVDISDTGDGRSSVDLPSKFEVCPRCEGHGSHDCWEGGMTAAEFAEQGPEFAEDYRSGAYSTTCETCGGRRVVEVLDRGLCPPDLLARYDTLQAELAGLAHMEAMERRYGA